MSDELFPQWYDSNDKGNYPFMLEASLTNGTVLLPGTTFADARLYPIGGDETLYISSVVKTDNTVTFNFSTTSREDLCSCEFSLSTPPALLALYDKFGRDAGVLVTSPTRLTAVSGWPIGTQEFQPDTTNFCASVITPMPDPGVRSITDDTGEEALYDEVYLVGGRGIRLAADLTDPSNPVVTVHATGEQLFKRLMCSELGFEVPCFLEGLKDVAGFKHFPDKYGNMYLGICGLLAPNTLLRINPGVNGLNITTVGKVV